MHQPRREAGVRQLQRRHGVAVCPQVHAPGTFVQGMGLLRIGGRQALGLGSHKGIGVLGKTAGHGLRQLQVAGRFFQQRFGQLQVERAGIAGQGQVFLVGLALGGQRIGHTLHQQLTRRTGGQQYRQCQHRQQVACVRG